MNPQPLDQHSYTSTQLRHFKKEAKEAVNRMRIGWDKDVKLYRHGWEREIKENR